MIKIYGKTNCGRCQSLKNILDEKKVPFGHSGTSPIIKFLVVPRRGIEPLFPE